MHHLAHLGASGAVCAAAGRVGALLFVFGAECFEEDARVLGGFQDDVLQDLVVVAALVGDVFVFHSTEGRAVLVVHFSLLLLQPAAKEQDKEAENDV